MVKLMDRLFEKGKAVSLTRIEPPLHPGEHPKYKELPNRT